MKTLLLILGPNGVGKSTVSAELLRLLPKSGYIESDALRMIHSSPDSHSLITVQKLNILALMRHYFAAPFINTVIFPYGLHGHRKKLLEEIIAELQTDIAFELKSIVLTCCETENIRRMKSDGRSDERIQRALANTRGIFGTLDCPVIDTTSLTPEQTAKRIIKELKLETQGE